MLEFCKLRIVLFCDTLTLLSKYNALVYTTNFNLKNLSCNNIVTPTNSFDFYLHGIPFFFFFHVFTINSLGVFRSEWVSWKCMPLGNALPILPFSLTHWVTSTYMWNVTEAAGLLPPCPSLSEAVCPLVAPQLLPFRGRCFSSAPFWFLPNFLPCEYF